jgi:hypothetical protein
MPALDNVRGGFTVGVMETYFTAKYRDPGETDWNEGFGVMWNQRYAAEKDAAALQENHPMATVKVIEVPVAIVEDKLPVNIVEVE